MKRKSLRIHIACAILATGMLFIAKEAISQTSPVGVRVSWPANPASENVGWYIVEWFDGSDDEWKRPPNAATSSLSIEIMFQDIGIGMPISFGFDFCARVTAAKAGNIQSTPSDSACVTWEEPVASVPIDIPDVEQLSKPTATIDWRY